MLINPLFVFLQAAGAVESVEEVADSTIIAVADSTQNEVANLAEEAGNALAKLADSSVWIGLLDKGLAFGLKLLAAIAIYLLGAWLIRLVKRLLVKLFERRETEKSVATFVTSLVSITLTALLILIAVGILGINTTSIAALLAAAGVAVGMALSGMLQNFAGGIMILLFKPFKSGDFISAQGNSGTVSHVSIVSTTITTVDNKCVILPNGTLFSGTIENFSQNKHRRVDLNVGVCYGTDYKKVIEVITKIVESDERVLHHKKGAPADPFIAINELADSSVNFTVRVWVKTADYWGVYFDLNNKIYDQLPKNGIEFPFPQLDVHMIK